MDDVEHDLTLVLLEPEGFEVAAARVAAPDSHGHVSHYWSSSSRAFNSSGKMSIGASTIETGLSQ